VNNNIGWLAGFGIRHHSTRKIGEEPRPCLIPILFDVTGLGGGQQGERLRWEFYAILILVLGEPGKNGTVAVCLFGLIRD